MPIINKVGPYEFRFYSRGEAIERPHVHARRENNHAKFWIDDVELAAARGFARHELRQIERIVHLHRGEFLEAWHEYFG